MGVFAWASLLLYIYLLKMVSLLALVSAGGEAPGLADFNLS